MERRMFITTGTVALTGLTAGCLSGLNTESSSDPNKVDFTEQVGQHLLVVQNNLTSSVEVVITTTGDETDPNYSNELMLEAGASEEITELFTDGRETYSLRLTAGDHSIEKTIGITDSPKGKSVFNITSDGIEYTREYRRAPDITVSNRLETQSKFRITVDEKSSDESPIYDNIVVPADGFLSFTDIFTIGTEYEIRVKANEMTTSTVHLNSATNSVSITLDDEGLAVGESER